MNTKGSLVAKHVPKHCGKSAHEDELNQGQCKNLDRDGMKGIFHTDSPRVSVEVGRLDGRLDLVEDDQFLCHVQTLRLREILGAESQERNQDAALISQMLIEGEAA